MVAGGTADLLQIVVLSSRPNTLLGAACPCIISLFQAEEDIFELIHPGIGKKERRVIVGNKAGTGDDCVPPVLKKIEKFCPDFFSSHENPLL
jgi:hypothetical protein